MRGVLGISLTAFVGFATPQAFAENSGTAQASGHRGDWQIAAAAATTALASDHPPTAATPAVAPASVTEHAQIRPPMPRARPVAAPRPPAPNSREDICNTLAASAQQHGLPIAFFGNLIYQESGLKPRVVSHVGARGIAQFMPGTARMVGLKNPFNPREALPASAKFLRSLLHQFGNNYGLAAAAYNAGPGRIQRWVKRRTILPKETRDYVMTITGARAEHWRGIRGNRFGHRLAQRMPCARMPAFAHIYNPVVVEREMIRKALLMLPRPQPLRNGQQMASAAPIAVAFVSPVNAAPNADALVAAAMIPLPAVIAKAEDRPVNVAPAALAATTDVASATESMALPRIGETARETTTGSLTTVMKSAPAVAQAGSVKTEQLAGIQPAERNASGTAKLVPSLPRVHPLRTARLASLKTDREPARAGKHGGKAEVKKAEAKKAGAKKADSKKLDSKKADGKKKAADKKLDRKKIKTKKTEARKPKGRG